MSVVDVGVGMLVVGMLVVVAAVVVMAAAAEAVVFTSKNRSDRRRVLLSRPERDGATTDEPSTMPPVHAFHLRHDGQRRRLSATLGLSHALVAPRRWSAPASAPACRVLRVRSTAVAGRERHLRSPLSISRAYTQWS